MTSGSSPLASPSAPLVSTRTAYTILAVLFLLNVLNVVDRTLFALAMEAFKRDFQLEDTHLGILQGCIFVGIGLATVPGGILLDRWGRKKTVTLMALSWSAATTITGFAHSFVTIAAGSFFTGAGQGAFGPSGGAWLSLVFPKKNLAKANSIFQMAGVVGGMIGSVAGGIMIVQYDWRLPFYIFGGIGLILGGLVMFMPDVKNAKATQSAESSVGKDIMEVLRIPTFWRSAVTFATAGSFAMVVGVWGIPLIMRAYGVSEAEVGALGAVVALVCMIGPIVGGIIADKLQQKFPYGRPLLGGIGNLLAAICTTVYILLAGHVSFGVFIALASLNATMAFFHQPSVQVINIEISPRRLRGTASSMQTLILFLLFSSWTAAFVGKVSTMLGGDLASLKIAMLCLVPLPLIGALCSFSACKTYPKDLARALALEAEEDRQLQG